MSLHICHSVRDSATKWKCNPGLFLLFMIDSCETATLIICFVLNGNGNVYNIIPDRRQGENI